MAKGAGTKPHTGLARDITGLFQKYRADHKMKRSRFGYFLLGETQDSRPSNFRQPINLVSRGDEHLLSESSTAPGEVELGDTTHWQPIWMKTADQVREFVAQAKEKIVQLGKAEKRRLLRVVDDDPKYDAEIELLSHSISQLLQKADRGIQEIGRMSGESVSGREIAINVQKSLAMGLSQVSQDLRKTQKEYMREMTRSSLPAAENTTSIKEILDAGFTEEQLLEMEDMETRVETRNIEISKIARSINDLNVIFKDLGNLIVEQGTVLDRIDYNIEAVQRDTQLANKELRKAESIQKTSRVQKCILMLAVFIFLNVLVLFMR